MKTNLLKKLAITAILALTTACNFVVGSDGSEYLGGWVKTEYLASKSIKYLITEEEGEIVVKTPGYAVKTYKAKIANDGKSLIFDVGMGMYETLQFDAKNGHLFSGGNEYVHIPQDEAQKRFDAIIQELKDEIGKPTKFPEPIKFK